MSNCSHSFDEVHTDFITKKYPHLVLDKQWAMTHCLKCGAEQIFVRSSDNDEWIHVTDHELESASIDLIFYETFPILLSDKTINTHKKIQKSISDWDGTTFDTIQQTISNWAGDKQSRIHKQIHKSVSDWAGDKTTY